MAFERDVLTAVTRARAAWSPEAPIPTQAATAAPRTRAVRSLFATVERYPEIRSAANVMSLQEEIERLEGMLADRRELYSDQVYRLSARIARSPRCSSPGSSAGSPGPSSTRTRTRPRHPVPADAIGGPPVVTAAERERRGRGPVAAPTRLVLVRHGETGGRRPAATQAGRTSR
jgi:hypothetical protein